MGITIIEHEDLFFGDSIPNMKRSRHISIQQTRIKFTLKMQAPNSVLNI